MAKSEFEGKVVLVTGAGRGAGRAIAEAFAAQGARLAANDISPVNLDQVAADIQASGGQVKCFVHDVAKKVAVQTLVNQIVDEWGRIDILVNSAAVEPRAPLLDMDEWDWHRVLDVNLTGAFLMIQSVGRVMRQASGGVIVNLAPIAGRANQPDRGAYVASKLGLIGLTRQAAPELAAHNIRLHAVCTGLPELASEPSSNLDVASAVLYLCGESAAHLNGQIVNIA
jgi:meso-butanediol dehydrogenase/(S,S)-butanediol dehydrogenase/diacetyl reductase